MLITIPLTEISEPDTPARLAIARELIDELAASMNKVGLLQPISVKKTQDGYEIEAGHRRYLAAKLLNWSHIDATVLGDKTLTDPHLERAHENLIREDLNILEEAGLVGLLVNDKETGIENTAKMLCKSILWVEHRLDVLQYPPELKEQLLQGTINPTVAKALSRCQDIDELKRYMNTAIEFGATARTVKKWISDDITLSDIDRREAQYEASRYQSADMGQLQMRCAVDGENYPMEQMRHLWLCPDCMNAMVQVSIQTQKEDRENKTKENTRHE